MPQNESGSGIDRLLLVDDDVELCELVIEYLKPEGFDIEVVHSGKEGVNRALSGEHAVIVLDVMLPGISGFEVLRRIRARSDVPVMMLTARGEAVDRIVGLEIGADDYLPKPFEPRELTARIRAILRRIGRAAGLRQTTAIVPKLLVGDIELDPARRTVRRAGRVVQLTGVEFTLLESLLREAGRVVGREDLSKAVLGRELQPYDRSLDVHVSNLRKKLGPMGDGQERIKTVRGLGYIHTLPSAPCKEDASGIKPG
jgi:two-component system, OmpR family, response regulator CpxR